MFDKDGGGTITSDEISKVLSLAQDIDGKTVKEMVNSIDANKDGEISFAEFVEMMKNTT